MENEGLKALKDLVNVIPIETYHFFGEGIEKAKSIIKKELKAKANLVSMCENIAKLVGLKEKDYVELETLITKKLKAFEIIKEKQVDVRMFIIYDLENYNKLQNNDYCKLTKAEDDLLKEVLL